MKGHTAMRYALRLSLAAVAIVLSVAASASTLTLSVNHHSVAINPADRQASTLLRSVWADEHLLADVQLDVYQLPGMRSTAEHYADLRKLAADARWIDRLRWSLTRRDTDAPAALAVPRIARTARRERGPQAEAPSDRDTRVAMTTLAARFDFGVLPVGDYRLSVSGGGLSASFDFSVCTGAEPEVRDDYLRDQASKTNDYAEFRRLEMERYERDHSRIDALFDLVDRSLQQGTPAEASADFDRAITAYEARRQTFTPDVGAKAAAYIRDLRVARDALPEYFQRKAEWTMAREPYSGIYSIRSRATNEVVRVLRATSVR
jgi:hypothetical protein